MKKQGDGSIETFGDIELTRMYRNDRIELWLRGFMSTDIFEEHMKLRRGETE